MKQELITANLTEAGQFIQTYIKEGYDLVALEQYGWSYRVELVKEQEEEKKKVGRPSKQ